MQTVKTMPDHICKNSVKIKINLLIYCEDQKSLALDTDCENNCQVLKGIPVDQPWSVGKF